MAISEAEDDRGLTLRAARGDQQAFEDLYRRYCQRLFDFALRTTRDAELAAGVVLTTFITASDMLRRGSAPHNPKAWLFGLARMTTIDHIRHRSSLSYAGLGAEQTDGLDFAQLDSSRLTEPDTITHDQELADLVWGAANSLSPSDYMLLDMSLRQGLNSDELAETQSLRRSAIYDNLSQLKAALEEAVTFTLLLRRGRRDCPELDALLADGEQRRLDAAGERLIRRHLAECPACSERQRRYPPPTAVFAGLGLLPLAPRVRQSIWESVADHLQRSEPAPQPLPRWPGGGPWATASMSRSELAPQPSPGWRKQPNRRFAAAVAVLAVLLLAVAAFTLSGRNAVHDPAEVRSTSHQAGQPSPDRIVSISWREQPDAEAFAVLWSHQPRDLPEPIAVLAGTATGTTSPPLEDGTWYFHLRTQGRNGTWTSTIHLGPFVIVSPPPTPTAIPSFTATAVISAAPEVAPTTPPAPTVPAATAAATRRPAATPTRTVTPRASAKPSVSGSPTTPAKPAASAPIPTARPASPPPPPPKATACPAFGNGALATTAGSGNKVAVSWSSGGGCRPYQGSITARYQQDPNPFATYNINQTSGTLTDSPPVKCQGSFPVVYTLNLQDASHQTTSAASSTTLVWSC